eukprot:559926-Amphidinium_carterae.1
MYETGSLPFVNSINATLTINKESTATDQLRRWAVLIDTGAITSVASREHFTHIPLKPIRQQGPQSLTAVNEEEINMHGGLDMITKNKLQLQVEGNSGYLARDYAEVKLDYIGNHFYLKATIFDGLCDYVSYTPDFEDWNYNWYEEYDNNIQQQGLWTTSRRC